MPKDDKQPLNNSIANRAKGGCDKAFGEIFDHYYPEIFGFVSNENVHLDLDVPDLAQLTFVKAANAISGLKSPENLRAWLYQIARNNIHDARGKKVKERQIQLGLVEADKIVGSVGPDDNVNAVHDWIDQLKAPLRETVVLVYLQGLNHREAGEVLDCAEGTISWRVSEAVKSLREIAETERKSKV